MEEKTFYTKDEIKEVFKKNRTKHILVTVVCSLGCLAIGIAIAASSLKGKVTSSIDNEQLNKFNQVYDIISKEWYFGEGIKEEDYVDRAIEAMVNGQDRDNYLVYYEATDASDITFGLGIVVASYDGYLIIDKVYSNSPASNAGLVKGDIITKVANQNIQYKTLEEVSAILKGDYGSEVELEILRNGILKNVKATRGTWKNETVYSYEHKDYAVLEITEFDESTANLVDTYLNEYQKAGINDLIIDLRDNPGGYVAAFMQIADYFIEKGNKLGRYEYRDPKESYDVITTTGAKYKFDNIYIFVNQNTASASEALTVSLKDNLNNVTVVGTNSYGKGIAQKTIAFSDGSSLKYTYAEFYRKNGEKVHRIGVSPDLVIKEEGPQVVFDIPYKENETFEDKLSEYLEKMGYISGNLETRLKAYQIANGIEATGIYDDATAGKIAKDLYNQRALAKTEQMDSLLIRIGKFKR